MAPLPHGSISVVPILALDATQESQFPIPVQVRIVLSEYNSEIKEESIMLLLSGFHNFPPTVGCSACPIGTALLMLEC